MGWNVRGRDWGLLLATARGAGGMNSCRTAEMAGSSLIEFRGVLLWQ